jgi:hypothetical protein
MSNSQGECASRLVAVMSSTQELKDNLRDAKLDYQYLEEERKFHAAKAWELQECIQSMATDDVSNKLVEKSLQIAELSMQVERLKLELQEAAKDRKMMDEEREANVEMMSELSKVIRTQQKELIKKNQGNNANITNTIEPENDPELLWKRLLAVEEERDNFAKKCETLERSVDTLKKKNSEREIRSLVSLRQMRHQVDILEGGRRRQNETLSSLEDMVQSLEEENQAKDENILALEKQFHVFKSSPNDPSDAEVKQAIEKDSEVKPVEDKTEHVPECEGRDDNATFKKGVSWTKFHLRDKLVRIGAMKTVPEDTQPVREEFDDGWQTDSTTSHTDLDDYSSEEFLVSRLAI